MLPCILRFVLIKNHLNFKKEDHLENKHRIEKRCHATNIKRNNDLQENQMWKLSPRRQ